MLWIKEVEMVARRMELPRHAINRRRRTSREDPNDGHKEDALPAPPTIALQPLEIQRVRKDKNT